MPLISLRSNSVTLPLLVEIFSLVERPLPVLPALPVKIYREGGKGTFKIDSGLYFPVPP